MTTQAGFFVSIILGVFFGRNLTIESNADFIQGLAKRKQVMGEDFVETGLKTLKNQFSGQI